MSTTTTTAVALNVRDFQYWDGGKWVNATTWGSVQTKEYIRLNPAFDYATDTYTAQITDDDPSLNDVSNGGSCPAGDEETGTAYKQTIVIHDSAGRRVLGGPNSIFSADSGTMNWLKADQTAVTDPSDASYTYTQSGMDTFTVALYGGWTYGSYQGVSNYILVGDYLPQPGEIFHNPNGRVNDASENDTTGYDPSLGDGYSLSRLICFAAGTLIETADGPRSVEKLGQGDLVRTKDNGLKPIQWIGVRTHRLDATAEKQRFLPVRIRAGALGKGMPARDLYVSQQHRILVKSKIAARMTGLDEVLVPAKKLIDMDGIALVIDCDEVTYVHFLLDQHEIVYSNGAETESLFAGPEALKSVPAEARDEILTMFPELSDVNYLPKPARTIPSGKIVKQLVSRIKKNQKPLYMH